MARDLEQTIAFLLNQAEGTTNRAEAAAFMEKAERLMLQHGIERANVQAKRPGTEREEVVTVRIHIPGGNGYAITLVEIAHAVGPTFSIRTFQSNGGDGSRTAWFVGHESDVEQATYLFESLLAQAVPQAKHWWKTEGKAQHWNPTDNNAYLARREFISAFASGVRNRLRETHKSVVAEASAGTELVLVDRRAQVDSWVDENMTFGKARNTQRKVGGYAAQVAGFQAGRDAVGTKALQG